MTASTPAGNPADNPYAQTAGGSPDAPVQALLLDDDGGTTIEYELALEDMLEFCVYHNEHSPAARRNRTMVRYGLPLVLTLGGVYCAALLAEGGAHALASAVIVGALLGSGIFWLIYPARYRKQLRTIVARMYEEGSNAGTIGHHRLSIGAEWLASYNAAIEARLRWQVVNRIVITPAAAYFYYSSVSAVIVPRRAFGSGEQFELFVDAARRLWEKAS